MTPETYDCLPCQGEQVEPAAVVFRDDLWACEILPGYDVPGWLVLRVRRHALRISSLTAEELATYGRRAREVIGAVGEVTGAPATYLLTFGEANPHFHSLIAARGAEVPPEHRLGGLLAQRTAMIDRPAALALVPAIAAAYGRLAAQSEPLATGV
jgi:diadenosine tetraphosphate (Ap4A) HIT family hydrolase